MARIRTFKPEFCQSLSLAEVSIAAERTFFGLIAQADDEGRHVDHAAIINGVLWALRPEHTPVHCADDLQQLASAELICRYTGCDGRQYLHLVTWHEHQKISHPSASRLPSCPAHERERRCGKCKSDRCARPAPEILRSLPETLPGPVQAPAGLVNAAPVTSTRHQAPTKVTSDVRERTAEEGPAQSPSPEPLRRAPEDLLPGSRILDPGSFPKGGGFAAPTPAPSVIPHHDEPVTVVSPADGDGVNAGDLVAEYVRTCKVRPSKKVLAHLGKEIRDLLAEGITPDQVRAGLDIFRTKPMSPSVLPSMVNEALNAQPAQAGHSAARAPYQPFVNPEDVRAAYEGDL